MLTDEKTRYNIITIEAAESGWIVRQAGKPHAKVFLIWARVVELLEAELTSKGDYRFQ